MYVYNLRNAYRVFSFFIPSNTPMESSMAQEISLFRISLKNKRVIIYEICLTGRHCVVSLHRDSRCNNSSCKAIIQLPTAVTLSWDTNDPRHHTSTVCHSSLPLLFWWGEINWLCLAPGQPMGLMETQRGPCLQDGSWVLLFLFPHAWAPLNELQHSQSTLSQAGSQDSQALKYEPLSSYISQHRVTNHGFTTSWAHFTTRIKEKHTVLAQLIWCSELLLSLFKACVVGLMHGSELSSITFWGQGQK